MSAGHFKGQVVEAARAKIARALMRYAASPAGNEALARDVREALDELFDDAYDDGWNEGWSACEEQIRGLIDEALSRVDRGRGG